MRTTTGKVAIRTCRFPKDLDRRVIPLTEPAVLIGRPSSSHDVEPHIDLSRPFEDPGVSRMHAVLERQIDGTYALVDPGSTNGTFLNNMQYPVTRRVQVALSAGDCIYLGFWTRIEIQAQS